MGTTTCVVASPKAILGIFISIFKDRTRQKNRIKFIYIVCSPCTAQQIPSSIGSWRSCRYHLYSRHIYAKFWVGRLPCACAGSLDPCVGGDCRTRPWYLAYQPRDGRVASYAVWDVPDTILPYPWRDKSLTSYRLDDS